MYNLGYQIAINCKSQPFEYTTNMKEEMVTAGSKYSGNLTEVIRKKFPLENYSEVYMSDHIRTMTPHKVLTVQLNSLLQMMTSELDKERLKEEAPDGLRFNCGTLKTPLESLLKEIWMHMNGSITIDYMFVARLGSTYDYGVIISAPTQKTVNVEPFTGVVITAEDIHYLTCPIDETTFNEVKYFIKGLIDTIREDLTTTALLQMTL